MAELFMDDGKAMLFATDNGDVGIKSRRSVGGFEGEIDGGRIRGRLWKIAIVEGDGVGLPR